MAERIPRATVVAVVIATTVAQIASVMGVAVFPVIAPKLAADTGLDASLIGFQVSLVYGTAMLGSPFLNVMIPRWGACRTTQVALGMCIAGMLLALHPSIAALALTSILLGLSTSVVTPASAHLLFRFSPAGKRNLIFSLKQTGVPLAWVLMALIAPIITLTFGWRWALIVVLIVSLATVIALQRVRDEWDDDRNPRVAVLQNPLTGLVVLWRAPVLRWLAMSSMFLTFVQLCLGTFIVTMLVGEAGYSLVAAGVMLSIVQSAGVVGRIVWGWLGDMTGDSLRLLVMLCLITIACCVLMTWVTPGWPVPLLGVLLTVFGVTAIGWNGLFLAEIARRSPQGQVGQATGAAVVWNFAGILIGPALFGAVYRSIGSYSLTYGLLSVIATGALALLIASWRAARAEDARQLAGSAG